MTNIVVVFPKAEEAKSIKTILVRSGFTVGPVCTTGAQAIAQADELGYGIIVCGYHMLDMMYSDLKDCMPSEFELLLVASAHTLEQCDLRDMVALAMPLKIQDLVDTVSMMLDQCERKHKRLKNMPKERKPEEMHLIEEAKNLLMSRNRMTEEEAHKYLQKCSMDSSTNMVETAQMVLDMFSG